MKKQLLVVVLGFGIWALGSPAAAQQPIPATPTAVDILVLPPTGDPLTVAPVAGGTRTTAISGPSPLCNLAPAPVGPTPLVNPTLVEFDDPFTAGRKCRVPLPVNLPNVVGLRVVAVFDSPNGPSGRSLVGVPPFNTAGIPAPPAAPTAVVVRP